MPKQNEVTCFCVKAYTTLPKGTKMIRKADGERFSLKVIKKRNYLRSKHIYNITLEWDDDFFLLYL